MEWVGGSGYPELFQAAVKGRFRKRLGDAAGLDQYGVNLTRLEPGSASTLRHWHENEDELVYVLAGEAVLIEDGGDVRAHRFHGEARICHSRPNSSEVNIVCPQCCAT